MRDNVVQLLARVRQHLQKEDITAAAAILDQMESDGATNPEAWHLRSVVAYEQGDLNLAVECAERSLALQSDQPDVLNNLGLMYQVQTRYEHSAACYQKAIALEPGDSTAHFNLGNLFRDQQQFTQARTHYQRALELSQALPEAHIALGALDLLLGHWSRGWPEYEWRLKSIEDYSQALRCPRWRGEPLAAKAILLHAEQGLGDTIQFSRYASVLRNQGATVFLGCQRPLKNLLKSCSGPHDVLVGGDQKPPLDFYLPLLSVPAVLKTTLDTIPSDVPYITADPNLVDHWVQRLKPSTTLLTTTHHSPTHHSPFRIGINWRGRPGQGLFRHRDVPLNHFQQLADLQSVALMSLQKDEALAELRASPLASRILDLGDELDTSHGAFMDTAAIMKNLDLVITSDTAIAHLAGALAIPVWVALPYVPDWRWLLDRSDSPWYPTMRLFRQPKPGDWHSVFQQIQSALTNLLQSKPHESN